MHSPPSLVITAPHARTMIKCCHSLTFTASELSRCRPQFGPFQFLRIFCRIKVGARPCSLGLPSISLPTIFGTFWKVFSDKRTRVIATQMSGATGKGRNVKIELSRLWLGWVQQTLFLWEYSVQSCKNAFFCKLVLLKFPFSDTRSKYFAPQWLVAVNFPLRVKMGSNGGTFCRKGSP